jgi:hypothetical protein
MTHTMLGLFNLGGGEIILGLGLLAMLIAVPAIVIGGIVLIVRMTRKNRCCETASVPTPSQSGRC